MRDYPREAEMPRRKSVAPRDRLSARYKYARQGRLQIRRGGGTTTTGQCQVSRAVGSMQVM
eukprot:39493-Prymnesium_polylepis.1